MREKLFVICDPDEQYLVGLQNYLEKKKLADFQFKTFRSLEQAKEYSIRNKIEILLLNELLYEQAVNDMQVGKLFLLKETSLGEDAKIDNHPMLMKYQSAERLLSSVLDSYAKDECCKSGQHCSNHNTRLITFYSPDTQTNQTLAALAVGQILSEQKKVLYLNLKPFSGLKELLRSDFESDLSDFIYFALKHSDRLVYKLGAIKRSVGGLDYIPSASHPKDLMQIGEEQWEQIMDALIETGDYENIILEVSEACQGLYRVLDRSDRIYTLYGESGIASAKLEEYRSYHAGEDFLKRTSFIPEPLEWKQREYDYTELAFGHPGQYMKGILYEDGIM